MPASKPVLPAWGPDPCDTIWAMAWEDPVRLLLASSKNRPKEEVWRLEMVGMGDGFFPKWFGSTATLRENQIGVCLWRFVANCSRSGSLPFR